MRFYHERSKGRKREGLVRWAQCRVCYFAHAAHYFLGHTEPPYFSRGFLGTIPLEFHTGRKRPG